MTRVKLIPEKFKTGKYSGSPRDFDWYETLKTQPRGGEDFLEAWYSEDPEESEYLNKSFQAHIDAKLAALKKEGWDPAKQFAFCVSQSHLDLGWMWHFRQGVAKAETTFDKLHHHFKLFSPFTFAGSQPAQYQWIKLHDKAIWNNVVDDVARRRHELQGGTWCEADGRMPSGEAWVRHCLYGQLFYARNFGRIANIAWFPDSFGFANNLPQIFAKSGLDSFFTTKLVSNKETKWPFWAWTWRAPDGSTLVSYQSGISLKLGPFGRFHQPQPDSDTVPESYKDSYKLLQPGQKLVCDYDMDQVEKRPEVSDDDLPVLGVFFGEGDGGHGPQGVEVATCRGMVDRGVATWSTAKEFFELVARYKDRLPVWNDELYYEFHRGSLTTQTLMKRMNRFFEWQLPAIEGLCTIAMRGNPGARIGSLETFYTSEQDQTPATRNAIEQIWQNVLLMQFHDVLSGTSIPEVYDECYEFWTQDKALLEAISREALQAVTKCHGISKPGPFYVHFPIALEVKVPGKTTIAVERLVLVPTIIANMAGVTFCQAVDVPVSQLQGLLPFGVILDESSGNMNRVQFVSGDEICPDIDKKQPRWIFTAWLPPWTTIVAWIVALPYGIDGPADPATVNTISKAAFSALGGIAEEKEACLASDKMDITCISFPGGTIGINKKTGFLDRLDEGGTSFIRAPCALKAYDDVPYREPCWNFQAGYWNHPKAIFDKPAAVDVIESGPVRHVVRSIRPFGNGSRAVIDYSVIQGVEGIGISIALDFHETETLIKYEIPIGLHATYSVAETCYATSKRRNKPEANRDVPRWEKWMHSFVLIESDDGASGLAVINEGKYGFDTRGGNLGISIVHGPRYPEANVVAWARDERKKRREMGLGEPPTHADQGPHLTRLWLLPYHESWRKGKVHQAAHGFNSPVQVLVLNDPKNARRTIGGREITVKILRSYIHDAQPKAANWIRWILSDKPSVEVTCIKPAEKLPPVLDSLHGHRDAIVMRVVNNMDGANKATLSIEPGLAPPDSTILETDLLERTLPRSADPRFRVEKAADGRIALQLDFKPHEIRTFKIFKE
ncbi:MAG: glycoside hydrolase family 38 C-terminal domain-containing protein [Candidatus Sigynarchaeota archaeon]